MRYVKIGLGVLLLLVAIFYFFASYSLSEKILFNDSSLENTVSKMGAYGGKGYHQYLKTLPEASDFEIISFDGTKIKAKYFTRADSNKCAIILLHGWGSTWAGMLKYLPVLEDCQCDLVFYDHRSHGESDDSFPTGGINESRDLLAITDWVNQNKAISDDRIGWLGESWGAAAALIAGAESRDLAFIIADSPYQDWYSAVFERALHDYGSAVGLMSFGTFSTVNFRTGVDYKEASPLLAAPEIEEAVLLIHSKADNETNSSQSVNISKMLKSEHSQFHNTDWGNLHCRDVINNPAEYKLLVQEFLESLNWACS